MPQDRFEILRDITTALTRFIAPMPKPHREEALAYLAVMAERIEAMEDAPSPTVN